MIYDPIDVRILVSNKRRVLFGGGGGWSRDPPDHPPGSTTALLSSTEMKSCDHIVVISVVGKNID